jgi:hypothetical protein
MVEATHGCEAKHQANCMACLGHVPSCSPSIDTILGKCDCDRATLGP